MTTKNLLKAKALEYGKEFVKLASDVAISTATGNNEMSDQHIKDLINKTTNEFVDCVLDITKL